MRKIVFSVKLWSSPADSVYLIHMLWMRSCWYSSKLIFFIISLLDTITILPRATVNREKEWYEIIVRSFFLLFWQSDLFSKYLRFFLFLFHHFSFASKFFAYFFFDFYIEFAHVFHNKCISMSLTDRKQKAIYNGKFPMTKYD